LGVLVETPTNEETPGAKHFRARGSGEKNARWLAKGQRGETSTKQPPAEVPLILLELTRRAAYATTLA
jgi:hypothetical protein